MIKELKVNRNIKIIHVGVDTQIFKPLSSKSKFLCDRGFKILTVARLHKYKGLEYLINAMKIVIKDEPEASLFIIGKGPEEEILRGL